ncbi:uncharacterized protein Z518_09473 [Rhinocladiella mackenziei CBS 650.93]|uniref:Rhinocladiella mackenziei CBS 650.93 unplaced genomic scaffold supercont1.7, whole genome shotgun sequence n=1 Tax=Rhinocladiella mackenziei CBS 650.93 TaxID=1442369 RepID=A0A0D2IEQ7_9EURO|nr:uncharacterized protein Z518_09473 [Rhinocladiella mackenziei CBS 650.93]KIX01746.1 hypothetical protein Z518_09473 [Rhinocladiella mackenziei CBS 650.93]
MFLRKLDQFEQKRPTASIQVSRCHIFADFVSPENSTNISDLAERLDNVLDPEREDPNSDSNSTSTSASFTSASDANASLAKIVAYAIAEYECRDTIIIARAQLGKYPPSPLHCKAPTSEEVDFNNTDEIADESLRRMITRVNETTHWDATLFGDLKRTKPDTGKGQARASISTPRR